MTPPAPAGSQNGCPVCPICTGRMEVVYNRFNQQVCVCVECHTGLSIPISAWEIQRIKRERKVTDEA
jgi:hypothetical protein